MDVNKLHKGFTTNPCRLHNIWCSNPSFSLHPKVVAEEDVVVTEAAAAEAAQVLTSSSNLLNDTQYQVLPSQNPGLELTMLSGEPLHCVFPVTPPEGEKTLECVIPTGEGKDSVCTVPKGGENSGCTVSGYTQSSSVQKCIYSRKRSASGGQTKAVPSGVGKTWVPPVDHRAHNRRIQVALQGTPKPIQGTLHNQQLRRLQQTKCLMDLYSRPAAERRSQNRSYPRQSGILQPSLPGSKTRQPLEASHRLEFTKQIPGHPKVQDGDPRVHTCLPQERGMGHIYRSHRRLLTCANSHPVSKIPQVSFQRCHLTVHQPPLRASNSPRHFHQYSQRGKTDSFAIRNQTPIPGRLVHLRPLRTTLHGSNTKTTKAGEGFGLYSKPQEVRTQTISEVRLPGLPLLTRFGSCEAHSRQVDQTSGDVPSPLLEVCYPCKHSYVHHWIACINGEDCKIGQDA